MIKTGFKRFNITRQLSNVKTLLSNMKPRWQFLDNEDLLMPTGINDNLLSDVEKRLIGTRY